MKSEIKTQLKEKCFIGLYKNLDKKFFKNFKEKKLVFNLKLQIKF